MWEQFIFYAKSNDSWESWTFCNNCNKSGSAVVLVWILFAYWKYLFFSLFYSKIMFVLQIGSISQTDSCNTNLSDPNTVDKAVLLQYSVNNGITWQVIAQHQPKDFIQAQRVSYNVPLWVPSRISLPLNVQDRFLLGKTLLLHHCKKNKRLVGG